MNVNAESEDIDYDQLERQRVKRLHIKATLSGFFALSSAGVFTWQMLNLQHDLDKSNTVSRLMVLVFYIAFVVFTMLCARCFGLIHRDRDKARIDAFCNKVSGTYKDALDASDFNPNKKKDSDA